jgi:hypothetical protein
MTLLTRMLATARYLTLMRQARELRGMIDTLPRSGQRALATLALAEIERVARDPEPRRFGDSGSDPYVPWSNAAHEAFQRAKSPVAQLKLKGMASWIAVVFHETRESPHPSLEAVHREVLGFLGILKGTYAAHARNAARATA